MSKERFSKKTKKTFKIYQSTHQVLFRFLYSKQKQQRRDAQDWLTLADRVYNFRRDVLAERQSQELLAAISEVRALLKSNADADRLKLATASLERVLRTVGGRFYPASSLRENVEFFLVAAIVIMGLRAYFLQPFKIPTNSMWPSYYGMTAQSFKPDQEPGLAGRLWRLVTLGATSYVVRAPADGEVFIPVFSNLQPVATDRPGRSLFIFPLMEREYVFKVGGQLTKIAIPADFNGEFERVLDDTFRGSNPDLLSMLKTESGRARQLERSTFAVQDGDQKKSYDIYWVPTGKSVKKGDSIMSFDLLTGDLLFVDRFTYNFFPPKIGSGIVFRTKNIPDYQAKKSDIFLVKRLVGKPGDRLQISPPILFRNGKAIDGSLAFSENARQTNHYPGYTNAPDAMIPLENPVVVPAHSWFVLGDNSPRSYDSRYWGFVPASDTIGRPLFIYYPFTKRWGITR